MPQLAFFSWGRDNDFVVPKILWPLPNSLVNDFCEFLFGLGGVNKYLFFWKAWKVIYSKCLPLKRVFLLLNIIRYFCVWYILFCWFFWKTRKFIYPISINKRMTCWIIWDFLKNNIKKIFWDLNVKW
jgi:hypothetical protein